MASVVCRQGVLLLERHWATIALVRVIFDVPGISFQALQYAPENLKL